MLAKNSLSILMEVKWMWAKVNKSHTKIKKIKVHMSALSDKIRITLAYMFLPCESVS